HKLAQVGTETFAAADKTQANAIAVQLRHFLFLQETREQVHQTTDFLAWTLPVFAAEGEQSQTGNTIFGAALDHGARALGTSAVTSKATSTTLLQPAVVAIHDDGDMPGQGSDVLKP